MLDAVMIALLFLSALWVLIVLADEIRTSVSGLRRRGFRRKLMRKCRCGPGSRTGVWRYWRWQATGETHALNQPRASPVKEK